MSSALKMKGTGSTLDLEQLRASIDQVDQELISLLKKRADLVFSVGEYKRQKNLPIYDPQRETRIRKKVKDSAEGGPLSPDELASVFMTLVERFRFLEGVHVKRAKAQSLFSKSHLNLSQSQHVVFWGFGLLGASMYLALNEVFPHWHFTVVDPGIKPGTFLQWREENRFSNIDYANIQQAHPAAIYVLGAPIEVNAEHLRTFEFPEKALVVDLGSTKKQMMEIFRQRQKKAPTSFTYIGGHPLAGKEVSGFQNGDALLFYNKVFCWTLPSAQSVSDDLKSTCEVLALALGAEPHWMTAAEHDSVLAWTSHLPQILSSVMASCLAKKDFSARPEYFPGVISNLLRISGSSFSMWQSILTTNQEPLRTALSELIQNLSEVNSHLPDKASPLFEESNSFYKEFKERKNKKEAI